MSPEDLEIFQTYISETRELLDEAEQALLELQRSTSGPEAVARVHALFRCFHSIKGAAATLGFSQTSRLTHAAESLLSVFRKREVAPGGEVVSLLLRAVDLSRKLTENVERDQTDSSLEGEVEGLRARLTEEKNTCENAPPAPAPPQEAPQLENLDRAEFLDTFHQEALDLLAQVESALLVAEQTPEQSGEQLKIAFRGMHSIKGNCGFMGQSGLQRLAHRAETMLEVLASASREQAATAIAALLKVVDTMRAGVNEILRSGKPDEEALKAAERVLGEATLVARKDSIPAPRPAPVEKPPEEAPAPQGAQPQRQDVRVDLRKLDAMVNLATELVIAEAMVLDHPVVTQAEDETFARAAHMLRRVSIELQDLAMALRMVPLSIAFRKLVRVVHDVSQRVKKQVKLELIGEETEVDKSVLEALSDPLVHLVRNSIDHGLESPADRKAKGKPEEGTVTVEARHAGGEVLVVIRDDGRGLDRNKILRKAIERGMIQGNGEALTDRQVYELIFEPGFSTASEVTDVSGRGVGMDVVRSNIVKMKGSVELRSRPGFETAVIMHIPLTVAIIDGMLVRVGAARYTLPLLAIREALRPEPGQVTVTPDGREIVRIRDQLLPVLRLHQVFSRPPDHDKLHEGILIVTEAQGRTMCLFADEILGQQQAVIKALSGYLGQAHGVSGCTILGDGEVSLILDVGALVGAALGMNAPMGMGEREQLS